MKPLVSKDLEDYVAGHTDSESQLLNELEKETYETMDEPEMLSGAVEGRLLQMLIRVSGAHRVLELGTFTGYSALMMAAALPEDGMILTCEVSRERAAFAQRYFDRSPHGKKIRLINKHAADVMENTGDNSLDLVFIDADKVLYPRYYDESLRIVKKGGLIIADNALWSGQVLVPRDDDSRAIAEFNRKAKDDSRVENVILTVRDGIHLIRKKA
jgi:caffeoyl-CoA O-methyltransferase